MFFGLVIVCCVLMGGEVFVFLYSDTYSSTVLIIIQFFSPVTFTMFFFLFLAINNVIVFICRLSFCTQTLFGKFLINFDTSILHRKSNEKSNETWLLWWTRRTKCVSLLVPTSLINEPLISANSVRVQRIVNHPSKTIIERGRKSAHKLYDNVQKIRR